MDMSFEDQIRERAYQIWLAGGRADGQAHDHWVTAEQAVLREIATESAIVEPVVIITKTEPAPAKPRKTKAKGVEQPAAKTPRTRKASATPAKGARSNGAESTTLRH